MNNQDFKDIDNTRPSVESLDLDKLKNVFLRSLPVTLLLILVSIAISTIAIRYTKQLFESRSILQLDIKSDAKVFGFKNFDEDINILAREIEIIKQLHLAHLINGVVL